MKRHVGIVWADDGTRHALLSDNEPAQAHGLVSNAGYNVVAPSVKTGADHQRAHKARERERKAGHA